MRSTPTILEVKQSESELSVHSEISRLSVSYIHEPSRSVSVASTTSERSVLVPKEHTLEEVPLRTFVIALMIAIASHGIAGMPSGAFRFVYVRSCR